MRGVTEEHINVLNDSESPGSNSFTVYDRVDLNVKPSEDISSLNEALVSNTSEDMCTNAIALGDDTRTNNQNEDLHDILADVAMSELSPANLLIVPVKLGNTVTEALVDTGANVSLIRSDIAMTIDSIIKPVEYSIMGVGKKHVLCEGEITVPFWLHGVEMKSLTMAVVAADEMKYPIVLGTDCFMQNKMVIDLSKSRISGKFGGDAKWDIYFGSENECCQIIYSQVPIRATENMTITGDSLHRVPVASDFKISSFKCEYCKYCIDKKASELMYDGNIDPSVSSYLVGYCGVVDDISSILVKHYSTGNINRCRIKKGDILGHIDTIVEVEVPNTDVDINVTEKTGLQWTADRIKAELEFCKELSVAQEEKVFDMLFKRRAVMSTGNDDVGFAAATSHRIELYDTTPIRQKPRVFPEPVSRQIEDECKKLLNLDIIEHSKSPFAAPVVPVVKKCGSLRLCVDYRLLNKVTKPDRFPVPNLREQVYSLHDKKYFTTLDLTSGFHQIPLDESSREYTAFSTQKGHYQFKRLAFGLKNCPAAFQRELQFVLHEFKENVLIYIDDILITSATFEEHLNLVERVLHTLEMHGMKIKIPKCHFFQTSVEFLGHNVGRAGISKSKSYITDVTKFPRPETVTQLRSFLGIVNFQRKFLPHCSELAKPLSELTGGEGSKRLTWTKEMTHSFETLKAEMCKEFELSYPDYSTDASKLELHVDASSVGAGCVLSQLQNGIHKTILYDSMTFSKAQRNYSVIERELTALRWAVKHLRCFLYGVPFVVYTDHKPLIYLHNASHINSRLSRTLDDLKDFTFELRYKPGRDNIVADYLSRIKPPLTDGTDDAFDDPNALPEGLELINQVQGGGDSMFHSLIIGLQHYKKHRDPHMTLPLNVQVLRENLVSQVIANPNRYGLDFNKHVKRTLLCMKRPGQLPITELLLVFSDLYKLTVLVHYGISAPILFCAEGVDLSARIHLQCLAGIHYNPVQETLLYSSKVNLDMFKPNSVTTNRHDNCKSDYENNSEHVGTNTLAVIKDNEGTKDTSSGSEVAKRAPIIASVMYSFSAESEDELSLAKGEVITIIDDSNNDWWRGSRNGISGLFPANHVFVNCTGSSFANYSCFNNITCHHVGQSLAATLVYCSGKVGCSLLDTGAQISLVNESMLRNISDNSLADLHTDITLKLTGVGKGNTTILGSVSLPVAVGGMIEPIRHNFAVVRDHVMNYCYILGVSFINQIALTLDFDKMEFYSPNLRGSSHLGNTNFNIQKSIQESTENISEATVNMCDVIVDLPKHDVVDLEAIQGIQSRDFALKLLKCKVVNKEPVRNYRRACLKRFVPYQRNLRVYLDILYYDNEKVSVPVVSFKFLVDAVERFHVNNAHIGIHKLADLVRKYLWHPSVNTVVRDVCTSCMYCQLSKTSSQEAAPPVRKIAARECFDLVVVDLLALPKTSTNFIGCFVAIDHYTKWLFVTPIRNKTGPTVASACERMLTTLPKCPSRILSDNGSEFKCAEFNTVLDRYNIEHTFSTPNHPSSCGEVERVNRTVIALLKAETPTFQAWDTVLPHAVLVYNNTRHSELKVSPSEYILANSHTGNSASLVPRVIKDNWSEGNPKYLPYKLGQRVLRKLPVTGRLTSNKLQPLYDGPYKVIQVQPNGVSYVIEGITQARSGVVIRAHHTQLKSFIDAPNYLRDYRSIDYDLPTVATESHTQPLIDIPNEYYLSDSSNDTDLSDTESIDGSDITSDVCSDSDSSENSRSICSHRTILDIDPVESVTERNSRIKASTEEHRDKRDFSGFNIEVPDNALKEVTQHTVKKTNVVTSTPRVAGIADPLDLSPISAGNESLVNLVSEIVTDNENMLTLIETTIAVQESILDHMSREICSSASELNRSFYDAAENLGEPVVNNDVEDDRGSVVMSNNLPGVDVNDAVVSKDSVASFPIDDSNTFTGFTPDSDAVSRLDRLVSARRRTSLSPLRQIIVNARRETEEFRRRNRIRMQNLGRRGLHSELSYASNPESYTPICTRSRGPVRDLANVQARTLEYKRGTPD